ncbi:CopG family transcriptional regulator [uncultured Corynebacterium sp.]|uniref:ribbon-helix-helix domain-containing protein n=1 Tax=uncultured Corynebacterium sp. TaxID=159447 RepID=UPI0025D84B62|nr:CopG family transcriptional regulator [uncultured Corynebacterium sp.]
MKDRPASLTRKPRPAPDEATDPVTPQQTTPPPGHTQTETPTQRRKRRVATVPLSTRLDPDVLDILDTAAHEHGWTIRAAIEHAITSTYTR